MPDPQQPAVARSAEVDAYLAAVPEPQRAALQAAVRVQLESTLALFGHETDRKNEPRSPPS